MAKVISGNHSSVIVPRQDRDSIRKFYCDILGGKITKEESERDFLRLGENFYIVLLYGDVSDESEFLRTARSVWLEIKSDNVEKMSRKILESGLVKRLEVQDPHLYFQAPGAQCPRSSSGFWRSYAPRCAAMQQCGVRSVKELNPSFVRRAT